MENINCYNLKDYIYNIDDLDSDQLEQLNIAIRFIDIIEEDYIRKIVFRSRNGQYYDNIEELIDSNRRYCNAITTLKGDDNREYFTGDDVIEANRRYWESIDLKNYEYWKIEDYRVFNLPYGLLHLDELAKEEIEILKLMINYMQVKDGKEKNGRIEREFYFLCRDGNHYSKFTDFFVKTQKYCHSYNKFKSDTGKEYYAFDDAIEVNREYWKLIYSKFNINSNGRRI